METISLNDFMVETIRIHPWSRQQLRLAKASKISTKNHVDLYYLVRNYRDGIYKTDLTVLIQRIVNILEKIKL